MTNNELVQKILKDIEALYIPEAPDGNQMYAAIHNAQQFVRKRITDIVQSYSFYDLRETDPDKYQEEKLREAGWLKLLPNENTETSQPNRFRYISPDYSSGVVIIDKGGIRGVYVTPGAPKGWTDRYHEVPWDTELTESLPK